MRQRQRFGLVAVMGAAAMALMVATPASARKFQLSGNWILRNGQVFIPLQFAVPVGQTAMGRPVWGSTGMDTPSGMIGHGLGFPNGAPPAVGLDATATGSNPAALRVPKHRFITNVHATVPLEGLTLVQITTNFGIDAPFQTETVHKSGGPGAFTWCPGDPACVAGGPPQGAGRNGRVIYHQRTANRFGGTLRLGQKRGGNNTFRFLPAVPFRVVHAFFGTYPPTRNLAPGGGSKDNPAIEKVFLRRGPVTRPMTPPGPYQIISHPGPKLTTGFGYTNSMTGMIYYPPPIATGPMGTLALEFTTNYGFPVTTGTVIAQQSKGTGGSDFFTFMGTDNRTNLGAGNITLVSGGIGFRTTINQATLYASMNRIKMTLGKPVPSMSPAGFAAAGALMLLAVGYALRRRLS